MKLYPFKFKPVYKDYLWGGRRLAELGKTLPDGIVAESWEISAHPNGESVIDGGALDGMPLSEAVRRFGKAILGNGGDTFPLLIKLIDARDDLSVQVHPDDEYARTHIAPSERGKNEAWFVLGTAQNSRLVAGTRHGIDKEALTRAVEEGRVGDVLNSVSVSKGDFIYIKAGLVHAIGKGLLIYEVQQASDTTYRVYDYDRVGADGKKRPLHTAQALEVIDCTLDGTLKPAVANGILSQNPYFTAEHITLDGSRSFNGGHFDALTFYDGSGKLIWSDGELEVKSGESVLVPAECVKDGYSLVGTLKGMRCYV